MNSALLVISSVVILWLSAMYFTERFRLAKSRRQFAAEQATAASLRSTIASLREVRDHWKEQSKSWRAEAMEQLERNKDLLAQLADRALPKPNDDIIEDPPTVGQADQKVVAERRARPLRGNRSAVAVADDDTPPVHRADAGDESGE